MRRLFIALWPGDAVREALSQRRDAIAWPAGTRPIATEKLHVTLHFIGSVPEPRLAEVTQTLAVPATPIELLFERAALWRNGLGVLLAREVPPALGELHAALAAALRRLDLPVERRPLRVHVTLARKVSGRPTFPRLDALCWPVGGYALVESTPDGRYDILRHYPCT